MCSPIIRHSNNTLRHQITLKRRTILWWTAIASSDPNFAVLPKLGKGNLIPWFSVFYSNFVRLVSHTIKINVGDKIWHHTFSKIPGFLHSPGGPWPYVEYRFTIYAWQPECCLHSKKFPNEHTFISPALGCICNFKIKASHSSATHSPVTHLCRWVALWS